jgi:hypothetical protein
MHGVQYAADRAVGLAVQCLTTLEPDSKIHDVQGDPRFQHRGIDLLWESTDGALRGVEVKGDRHARRGNYFFELISNLERDTPGCFLYSQADWLLYVFLETREVHRIPLANARAWFLPRSKEFELRHTQTHAGEIRYTTVGALVPVKRALSEVDGIVRSTVEEARSEGGA